MDINSAPRGELVRLIYEMTEIQLLEGEVAKLKEQLHEKGKDGGSSTNTPVFVKANKKKKQTKAAICYGVLPLPHYVFCEKLIGSKIPNQRSCIIAKRPLVCQLGIDNLKSSRLF